MARGLVVIIISLAVPFLVAGCRPTEPKFTGHLEVGEADPTDIETVSFHDKCAGVLKTFVDSRGMVDYERLRRQKDQLATLLEEFGKLDGRQYSSWPKADKMAF